MADMSIAGKIAGGLIAVAAVGGVGFFIMSQGHTSRAVTPIVGPAAQAAAALSQCDTLAADPNDPNRYAAPVPDDKFAPGAAISACKEAVRLNPQNPRASFQLGRSYWIARRDSDAFRNFVNSASQNYAAAKKYIGDAYFLGRGLPAGEVASADTAIRWYNEAISAGYVAAGEPLRLAQIEARRHNFDKERDGNQFLAPDYVNILYTGDFNNVESPVGLTYYVQGLVHRLDSDQTLFMDQTCKPLSNAVGNMVVDYAQMFAIVKLIIDSQNKTQDEKNKELARALLDYMGGDKWSDTGDRDGTVLFNKDVYGCDSPVTKRIMNNIMLKLRIGDNSAISVSNQPN